MRAREVLNRAAAGLHLALLLAFLHPACGGESQDDTLIVLEVDSDLAVPAQLDQIDITVIAPNGSEVTRSFPLEQNTLPVRLALVPEGDPSGAFTARVVARAAGKDSLTQEIRTAFLPDQARRLPIFLGSDCLTVTCPDQQTCRAKECMTPSAGVRLFPLASDGGATPDAPTKDAGPPPDACPGLTCDSTCVNSQTDPKHCGACNTVCEGACLMGACEPIYKWLVIVDQTVDLGCTTSTGPGADIDSIAVSRPAAAPSVGLKGSPSFVGTFPDGIKMPACASCLGGTPCAHSTAPIAVQVAGTRDATVTAGVTPDTGYLSLNRGAVWLQLGNATGDGPPQFLKRGDTVTVNEVDKTYPFAADPQLCRCDAEKYAVFAYREKDQPDGRVRLMATGYRPANMASCGALNSLLGCGTTDFKVP